MKKVIYIKKADNQKFNDYIDLNQLIKIKQINLTPEGSYYQVIIKYDEQRDLEHLKRFMDVIV
jgi:hypothetical protein